MRGCCSDAEYDALRETCATDEAALWGPIAASTLHWFHDGEQAWLRQDLARRWIGWAATDGSPVQLASDWTPWRSLLVMPDGPHTARWFVGARTNAAFNEVDLPVLCGGGSETAFICEPPVGPQTTITRRELLLRSVAAAHVLREVLAGIAAPRIAVLLPNGEHAVVWIQVTRVLSCS